MATATATARTKRRRPAPPTARPSQSPPSPAASQAQDDRPLSLSVALFDLDGRPADDHFGSAVERYRRFGPLGTRIWTGGTVGMFHASSTRLDIEDAMPRVSEDHSLAITGDVRIDNRDEILARCGHRRSLANETPDSYAALLAYQRWGVDAADHLEGDFAFVIYDRNRRQMYAARSCFPVSNLYFVVTKRQVAFATLARPLLDLTGLPRRLDEESFGLSVARLIPTDPQRRGASMFAGVSHIPAGTWATVSVDGKVRQRTYWEPTWPDTDLPGSDDDHLESVRSAMVSAVTDRMRTDGRVGVLLSGGLDSSSIAGIAAVHAGADRRSLAIASVLAEDHSGPERDEREYIEIVARHHGIDVEYVTPAHTHLSPMADLFDTAESPGVSIKRYVYQSLLQRAGDRGVGVLLDGVGGEFGPSNHAGAHFAHLLATGRLPTLVRDLALRSRVTGRSIPRIVAGALRPWLPGSTPLLRTPLVIRPGVRERLGNDAQPNTRLSRRSTSSKPRMAATALLVRERAMSIRPMTPAHLFPFKDRRVIDACLAVPERMYSVDGWTRSLIRRSMEGIVPPAIQWRTTKGPFSPDFYRRFTIDKPGIRAELAALGSDHPGHDWFDVPAMLRVLDGLPPVGGEKGPEGVASKVEILAPVHQIRFLDWFHRHV